jgi:phosphoglycolate phosphatase
MKVELNVMLRYPVILFDLDGTLLDTLQDLAYSVNAALQEFGLPCRSLEEIRNFVGNGAAVLMEKALPMDSPPDLQRACLSYFRDHYAKHLAERTAPYQGIAELLAALERAGARMAVISNKPNQAVEPLVQRFFGTAFAAVLGETPELAKKPEPDMVLYILKHLGARPGEAVYVGDSEVDILTAQNAALPCCSVTWGFRSADTLRESGAKQLFRSPEELRSWLLP